MAASFLSDGTAYPGGKGRTYQHVINVMPPHSRYIETHLGAGAVMRNKRPAKVNIGIELDQRVVERWARIARPDVQIIHGDALQILTCLTVDGGDLVYCDPPFHPATRRRPGSYRHDLSAADHERLLDTLAGLRCQVVLSGYANELYERRLAEWTRTDFQTRTHAGAVTESIWTNFQPGCVLHDYRFVGTNFRERERFRRRTGRLAGELGRAAELELNAALAALAEQRPDALLAAAGRLT
ncbi:MAG: adenine methylase [Sphingomonadales bacterium]|jgi:site-specific DNA-adenine methylase|nr:adenine methylase [Sphingomonadales bacterium]